MSRRTDATRRQFLKRAIGTAAGAVACPCIIPSSALGRDGTVAPSNRIVMGAIGVGNRGGMVLDTFLRKPDVQVVAISDVDSIKRDGWRKIADERYAARKPGGRFTGCTAHNDFRELLAQPGIDAVLIATPDQWHVLNALAAVRAGIDVYLEKPMGLSLAEDQALRAAVRRHGRVLQYGTQQRSDAKFRLACELVHNNRIGKLHTINVWSPVSRHGGSLEVVPVPKRLDYDLWLGPAPFTPYTRDRCSNHNLFYKAPEKIWPFISDYCLGWIAGWGVHPLDIALWGGGDRLRGAIEVEGTATFPTDGACDTAIDWDIVLKYESGVTIHFAGQPAPAEWKKRYGNVGDHGTVFEGTEGWVHVRRGYIDAYPKSVLETPIGPNDTRLYNSDDHSQNFLDCIRSRAATICPIDAAVRVDILCHLSDIATQLERKLKWDPDSERFVNDNTANRFLTRAMRSPWHL